MCARQRNRLQVDERRAQLLDLAIELFGQRTYDAISIDEIAKAAGISKGLLYHYFPSKREYYVAALRATAVQLREETERQASLNAAEGSANHEGLRAGIDAYLAFVDKRAIAYAFLLGGGLGSDEEVQQIIEETRTHYVERILEEIPPDAVSALLRTALRGWVGFVEAASLEWIAQRKLSRAAMTELLVNALVAIVEAAQRVPPGGDS